MRRILFLSVAFVITLLLSSCAPKHSEMILAKFGDRVITVDEFEAVYSKNVTASDQSKEEDSERMKNFLDLYVNFKMKLRDAEVRGYPSHPELNDELYDYKKKVGVTYLLEKDLVEPGVKSLYDKRKYELRVSHIMLRLDTLTTEQGKEIAENLIQRINSGEKFEDLAFQYSHDQFSREHGGDIYFITAGMLVPEFEDASFATPVGEIYPEPLQTRYGFHIIKVTDKQERVPQIRASHILINFFNEENEPDTLGAQQKADEIYQRIIAGEDFATLAIEYSADPGSKDNGGDLGYFERRMMVKDFDYTAFNLEKIGDISKPVKTNFGFHIIKLTDRKPYPSFEEDKENVKRIYKQTRYDAEYADFITSLKEKFNFSTDEKTFDEIVFNADTIRFGNNYRESELRSSIKNSVIYTINNNSITVDSLFAAAELDTEFNNKPINKQSLRNAIKKISENKLLELEAMQLEKTSKEFASLMEDYRNGIYIFRLQDDEVWSKIDIDSVRLYDFYLSTKEKYVWPDRVRLSEIFVRKDSLANELHKQLMEGAEFEALAAEYTERPGFKEKEGDFGIHDAKANQLAVTANSLKSVGDISEPFANAGGYSIIRLDEKIPAGLKSFEEAKAEVSGAFQESESKRLENEYIDLLKSIYNPVIYYDRLEHVFAKEQ